jgi:hypothetical protein
LNGSIVVVLLIPERRECECECEWLLDDDPPWW